MTFLITHSGQKEKAFVLGLCDSYTGYVREYFYTVDRSGRLKHDGTELTDPKFLKFFFERLQRNETGKHSEYPFVSPCAGELNFILPEDTPIIFQNLTDGRLFYAPDLSVSFEPDRLRFSSGGLLYHPSPVCDFSRMRSSLLLELAKQVRPWGPYYLFEEAGRAYVIEPLEKKDSFKILRPQNENGCFACGASHTSGVYMSFLFDPEEKISRSWLFPDERFQGRVGWMHGGFIALFLDEIMAKVLSGLNVHGPTVNMNVDYRSPCRLGREVLLTGFLERIEGRKFFLKGEMRDTGEDRLIAEAKGLYLRMDRNK